MRVVYIDESYDKRNFLICGVMIVAMKYGKFNREFNQILKQECGLDEDDELKGDELFNGRGSFGNLSLDERAELVLKIGKFLGKSNITKFIVSYKSNYSNKRDIYLQLLDVVVSKAAKITSKAGRTGRQLMIIFDEVSEEKLDKKIYEKLADKKKKIIKKYKKSCSFFDYGYSGISKNSRMLQVADFVAYFIRNQISTPEESNLFGKAADERKITLLKEFKNCISSKLVFVK
jgi:hypothetical protein